MLPKAESFNWKLMGREIEIKIPLTAAEYDRLLSFVNGSEVRELSHIRKSDRYYSRYTTETERRQAVRAGQEPNVIRIRTEENLQTHNKQSYFCYKYKTVEHKLDIEKIIDYCKKLKSENPHHIKANYVKKIEVENK